MSTSAPAPRIGGGFKKKRGPKLNATGIRPRIAMKAKAITLPQAKKREAAAKATKAKKSRTQCKAPKAPADTDEDVGADEEDELG